MRSSIEPASAKIDQNENRVAHVLAFGQRISSVVNCHTPLDIAKAATAYLAEKLGCVCHPVLPEPNRGGAPAGHRAQPVVSIGQIKAGAQAGEKSRRLEQQAAEGRKVRRLSEKAAPERKVGILFDTPYHCAVLDIEKLLAGVVALRSNSYRGDNYEWLLRKFLIAQRGE